MDYVSGRPADGTATRSHTTMRGNCTTEDEPDIASYCMAFQPKESLDLFAVLRLRGPHRFTRMVGGNQPDVVPDEKPSPNMETRILRDAARQRISEIIGPYFMDATAMVDGDLVRNKDERPIRFKIWAPHRKIAIERLPKGVAANNPAVLRRAERLKDLGITYIVFVRQ